MCHTYRHFFCSHHWTIRHLCSCYNHSPPPPPPPPPHPPPTPPDSVAECKYRTTYHAYTLRHLGSGTPVVHGLLSRGITDSAPRRRPVINAWRKGEPNRSVHPKMTCWNLRTGVRHEYRYYSEKAAANHQAVFWPGKSSNSVHAGSLENPNINIHESV